MSFSDRIAAHKRRLDENKDMIARVEHCIRECSECNDWEDEFLESVLSQLLEGRTLTDRQVDTLEKIEVVTEFGRGSAYDGA